MTNEALYTETIGKYIIDIDYDNWAENPFDNDYLETFGIDLSGKRDYASIGQSCPISAELYFNSDKINYEFEDSEEQDIEQFNRDYYSLPVYCYEHGQIAFSTGSFIGRAPHAHWDSGAVGLVFISKKEFDKEFSNLTPEDFLKSQVELLSSWANGDVYHWNIVDTIDDEVIESVGGYYGNYDEALKDARDTVQCFIDRDNEPKKYTHSFSLTVDIETDKPSDLITDEEIEYAFKEALKEAYGRVEHVGTEEN